jgi:hypothetical protein
MRDRPAATGRSIDAWSPRHTALLVAVAAVSLAPRLWLALTVPLSHNGAWHLFAARNFTREFARIAHPPLFLPLLKGCDAVSRSLLSYRLLPLLAGAGSVFLVGRLLAKLGCRPATSVLGALTIAASTVAIALSVVVEAYTLCVFCVLAAFWFYLDLIRVDALPSIRSRIAFSSLACAALLFEYLTGIFLIACVGAPLLASAVDRKYGRQLRQALSRRLAADVLTFLPPVLVGALLYALLARRWITVLSGLPLFYFQPAAESAVEFLVRNSGRVVRLFSPFPQPRHGIFTLAAFLLFAISVPVAEKQRGRCSDNRIYPALFLTLLLFVGATLGLLGRYPFGGAHRHQILLLFFAVLAGFVAFDGLLPSARRGGRVVLVLACAGAIGWSALRNRDAVRKIGSDEPLSVRAGIFQKNLSDTSVVHLDLMNFIGLFMDFYAWDCRYAGQVVGNPLVERYEFSRQGKVFTVLAHRWIWVMDFRDPALYWELRASVGKTGSACDTVFCVNRNLYGPLRSPLPDRDRDALERRIPALARAAGLTTRSVVLGDDSVEAGVCSRP